MPAPHPSHVYYVTVLRSFHPWIFHGGERSRNLLFHGETEKKNSNIDKKCWKFKNFPWKLWKLLCHSLIPPSILPCATRLGATSSYNNFSPRLFPCNWAPSLDFCVITLRHFQMWIMKMEKNHFPGRKSHQAKGFACADSTLTRYTARAGPF